MQHESCYPRRRNDGIVRRRSYVLCRKAGVLCGKVQAVCRISQAVCRTLQVARRRNGIRRSATDNGRAGILTDMPTAISLPKQ